MIDKVLESCPDSETDALVSAAETLDMLTQEFTIQSSALYLHFILSLYWIHHIQHQSTVHFHIY